MIGLDWQRIKRDIAVERERVMNQVQPEIDNAHAIVKPSEYESIILGRAKSRTSSFDSQPGHPRGKENDRGIASPVQIVDPSKTSHLNWRTQCPPLRPTH
jgi:hypothetical protein